MVSYEAVLFDNDGILTTPPDTDPLRRAARSAFEAVGVEAPDPDHVDGLIRGVRPDWFVDLCAEYGADPATFWARRDAAAAHDAGIDSAFVRRPHRREYALSIDPAYEIDSLSALEDV